MFQINQAAESIINKIQNYAIFDFYRIVDVETYEVYDLLKDTLIPAGHKCYDVWCRQRPCVNCTSDACLHKQHEIVKLECLEEKIFWVMSLPFPELGKHKALELIKDVTNIMYINDRYHKENETFSEVMAQVEHSTVRDPYTDLFSKRYIQKKIEEYLESKVPICLVLLDLDRFKLINDTYGHLSGDEVLLYLAKLLKQLSQSDHCEVGRIGGDEFLMIYKDTTREQVEQEVTSLLETFAIHPFVANHQDVFHVSASAGIACSQQEDTWEQLFNRVDERMYERKERK